LSFFDRLGDLAKSLGNAAVAQPRFIWDIAQAPFNDNKEYNGFKQTLETASNHWAQATLGAVSEVTNLPGIKQTLETAMVPYRNYVAPAIGAGLLTVNPNYREEYKNLSGMDLLSKAFQEGKTARETGVDQYGRQEPADKWRRKISPGQALIGDIAALMPGEQGADKVDWGNQSSIESFYGEGLPKFFSGASDLGFSFLDPTLALGKVSKGIRATDVITNTFQRGESANAIAAAANRKARASQEIIAASDALHAASLEAERTGVEVAPAITNKYTQVIKDLTANDRHYAIAQPFMEDAPAKSTIAYALGESNDFQLTGQILAAVGVGDKTALKALQERPEFIDIGNSIARAQGEADELTKYLASKDQLAVVGPDGQLPFEFPHESSKINMEAAQELEALKRRDAMLADLLDASKTGQFTRTVGSAPIRAFDRNVAEARIAKYNIAQQNAEKKIFGTTVTEYQPTPFHRLIQVIARPLDERPAGHINLNDSDSLAEISATVERGLKLMGGNKLGFFDTERAGQLIGEYTAAQTPEARSLAVKTIERDIAVGIAQHHGVSLEKAKEIYAKHDRGRDSALTSIKRDTFIIDEDGRQIHDPWFESQSANTLPIMDFDLLNSLLKKNKSSIPMINDLTTQTIDGLDFINDLFKAGALIRAGYLIRNTVEAQLRIGSTLGVMTSLRHLGPGMKNFVYNSTKNEGQRSIDRLKTVAKSPELAGMKSQINDIDNELVDIEKLMEKYAARGDDTQALADLNMLSSRHKELTDLRDATSAAINQSLKPTGDKRRLFTGTFEYEALNGKKYYLPEAFSGPFAELYRSEVSSAETLNNFIESHIDTIARGFIDTGTGVVKPGDPAYWENWAETLTRQFGNSAVVKELASGKSPEKVAQWLYSGDGRTIRYRLEQLRDDYDTTEYVARTKNFLDRYLPDPELQAVLANPRDFEITVDMLKAKFGNWEEQKLPVIHGRVLEENLNMKGENVLNRLRTAVFKVIGSMPEDSWSRNPVYSEFYNKEFIRRLDEASLGLKADEFIPADVIWAAEKAARQIALRDTKKLLFTIDRKTNAATTLRWVMPFFSAYLNTARTWGRIIYDNPSVAVRGYNLVTAPNRAGNAYDQEGNLVSSENAKMDDTIILHIPEGMKKIPFVGKGLSSLSDMGIQKKSLDVIMQGNLTLPLGPPVAIAASEVVKRKPQFEDTLRWAIPYGPERNAAMALLPAWAKRQITKGMGQDSPEYANTYELIWNTEQFKRKQAGQTPATEREIKDMADAFYNMRTVANLILPFAPKFNTPYKFYIDQFHSYQNLYGIDAKTKFFEDYPEFFSFSTSLSKNNTGAAATVGAVDNSKKYADLIADIRNDNPKLIGLVANTGVTYDFSQAAYMWQQSNTLSPGSSETFRGVNDPVQAQQETEATLGWIKYRKVMDQIDAVMASRGLTNLRSNKAADLAALKKGMVQQLGQENKAWYDDYLDSDGSKTNKAIRGFEKILSNKKFMADNGENPTWKSLAIYLGVRQQVSDVLVKRGGTALTNKKNADLAALLEDAATQLKQQDIGFGDIYDRYLDSDRVFDIVYSTEGAQ
jgi:hypothetical protein